MQQLIDSMINPLYTLYKTRRGGREAEGGGLLNRYTINLVSWVRIPSPPPFSIYRPLGRWIGNDER